MRAPGHDWGCGWGAAKDVQWGIVIRNGHTLVRLLGVVVIVIVIVIVIHADALPGGNKGTRGLGHVLGLGVWPCAVTVLTTQVHVVGAADLGATQMVKTAPARHTIV
jgi:hypothetical protein